MPLWIMTALRITPGLPVLVVAAAGAGTAGALSSARVTIPFRDDF